MKRLAHHMTVLYAFFCRDWMISASYTLDFFLRIFAIVFWVLMLYFISQLIQSHPLLDEYGGFLPYSIVGFSVLIFYQTGVTAFSKAIRQEQMMGTLEYLLLSPISMAQIIIGSSLWNYAWASLSVLLYWLTADVLFEFPLHGPWLPVVLLCIVSMLIFLSIGILSASFVIVFKKGDPVSYFLSASSAFIGGTFFPVELFPQWIQNIAYLLPITYSLDAFREVLLKGGGIEAIAVDLTVLSLFLLVFLPFSIYVLKISVRFAKQNGSLLHY